MAPATESEVPIESFERLRQCLDVIKNNHYDPWNWHEYLGDDPPEEPDEDEDGDPEMFSLKPKGRRNVDRMKGHLLACVSELNRAASAADQCYLQLCCSPEELKPCATTLGTSGDIDADLLLASGDASPEKLLAALQVKLDVANARIADLEAEVSNLKDRLVETQFISEDRWRRWQNAAMLADEAINRLDAKAHDFNDALARENSLQAAYKDLYLRFVRASRLMIYKGRQMLRDTIFKVRKDENIFYFFHGFMEIVRTEREERLRREHEAQRDAVEFALRNEVRFLLGEKSRTAAGVKRLTVEASRLKKERRESGCRIMYKLRPHEPLEYCLWVWELWESIRPQLVSEKKLATLRADKAATEQMLVQTSKQLAPMAQMIDELRDKAVAEKIANSQSRKQLTAEGAQAFAALVERLRSQRAQELGVLKRLHQLDNAAKDERIAILEREIAEDKHINALRGMVVDLEGNLRKAMDRRKQKGFEVPPGTGFKCSQCQRETLFRGWLCKPPGAPALVKSASDADLSRDGLVPPGRPWPAPREQQATYAPVWR